MRRLHAEVVREDARYFQQFESKDNNVVRSQKFQELEMLIESKEEK